MSDAQTIRIQPALRPRLEFLATAGFFVAVAAVCTWMGLTRGREILDPNTQLELGGLEPFKHILVGLVWSVVAIAGLLALWSLWAVAPASGRLRVVIADGLFEWRPYIGPRVRFEIDRLTELEDRPGGRFVGPCLALRWGRRRKPLKLLRKWYLPLDVKRLREELQRHLPAASEAT